MYGQIPSTYIFMLHIHKVVADGDFTICGDRKQVLIASQNSRCIYFYREWLDKFLQQPNSLLYGNNLFWQRKHNERKLNEMKDIVSKTIK